MSTLRRIKLGLLDSVRAAGGFRTLAELPWRQDKLLILCYHGISMADEHEWDPALFMSQDMFASRMELLRKGGYSVLPLAEALGRVQHNRLPRKSVAITFDDGLADFKLRALPVLQAYDYPATVYLTTYYCLFNRPVFNVIVRYMLWKKRGTDPQADTEIGWNIAPDLHSPEGRDRALQAILDTVRQNDLSGAEKDDLAARLALNLGLNYEELVESRILRLMLPEEVRQIAAAGMDVQLHTHRHRTPNTAGEYQREIEENRTKIAEILGKKADHFCYPSGNYQVKYRQVLRNLDLRSATTCYPGLVSSNSDPLTLPRHIDTSTQTATEFEGWLCGAQALLRFM